VAIVVLVLALFQAERLGRSQPELTPGALDLAAERVR
jgi:hypothetical protein